MVFCLVCGKKFPRGSLDLSRHVNTLSIQHLTSSKPKPGYDYNCKKCDLYFTTEAHLHLHVQSICPIKDKQKELSLTLLSESGDSQDICLHEAEERSVECMVCGKLFPRGPIDLARHATAITLRHLVNPKHTNAFHFACKKCNLHFSSAEHLLSHAEHTSCNEAMVWPTTVHPGSKCVTRAEAAALQAAEAAGELAHTESKMAATSTKENKKQASSLDSSKDTGVLGKRIQKRTAHATALLLPTTPAPLSKYKLNKLARLQEEQRLQQLASSSVKRSREESDCSAESFHDLFVPRQKRAKVIVPEDRKAFFAVVSLLVDASTVPESVRLDEDNYEAYIPPRYKKLVDVLKAIPLAGAEHLSAV